MRRNAFRAIYYVIFTGIFSQANCQTQQWISLSDSQIEILTSNSESEGQGVFQVIENAREFFESVLPAKHKQPVRIFAFQSKNEFAPYRLNSNAFGHFLHSPKCDYIALEDIKPEHYEAALHEYTHYVIKQADFHLPTWLNEGLADLYSSLESNGQQAIIGRLLPGRMFVLEGNPLMDLKPFLKATLNSPYYGEGDKISIFYAQSWALTHMLALDPPYSAKFSRFLQTVSSGVPSPDALLQVYGRNLQQVETDLKQYLPRMAANTASYPVQFRKSSIQPQVKALSNHEKMLALADLLAAHPATASKALQTLTELAKENPDNPLIEEKMGYAAWNMNRVDDARSYFAHAIEHGSHDSDMIYRYAIMQKQAGASDKEVIRLFERVLELSPDFDDARFHLAILEFNGKRFSTAAQLLSKLSTVKDEWAYNYYSIMTYCDVESGHIEEAKIFSEKARSTAQTAGEKSQADRLFLYLQAQKPSINHGVTLASAQDQHMSGKDKQSF